MTVSNLIFFFSISSTVNEWNMLNKEIIESSSLSAFEWKLCYNRGYMTFFPLLSNYSN